VLGNRDSLLAGNREARQLLAAASDSAAGICFYQVHQVKARTHLARAIPLLKQLLLDRPDDLQLLYGLARSQYHSGALDAHDGKNAEAIAALTEALSLFGRIAEQMPDDPQRVVELASTEIALGKVYVNLENLTEARQRLEQAIVHSTRAMELAPTVADVHLGWAVARMHLAHAEQKSGDSALATELVSQTQQAIDKFIHEHPGAAATGQFQYNLACVYALGAQAELPERQETLAAKSLALLKEAHTANFFADEANTRVFRHDKDLDFLRTRDDFRELEQASFGAAQ
jgi:tetratricopeptide (TPR) repeat protein